MLWLMLALFTWLGSFVRSRHDLGLEIVALRQQLIVLKRRTKRTGLCHSDRLFWVTLRRLWPNWSKPLLIVKPDTHKRGPKQAHKLTDEVVAFIVETRQKQPHVRTAELVRLIQERFGAKVHPRSIERSLLRHQKKRH